MDSLTLSLKNNNLKVTSARKIIFDTLDGSKKALSPKEVFTQLSKKTDMVSIYRNLSLFTEIGLVHKFQDGRYALCQHKHKELPCKKHVHIMMNCISCGLTEEIKGPSVDISSIASYLKTSSKFMNRMSSLILQGECLSCSQESGH